MASSEKKFLSGYFCTLSTQKSFVGVALDIICRQVSKIRPEMLSSTGI
jgi:hypothetical protein